MGRSRVLLLEGSAGERGLETLGGHVHLLVALFLQRGGGEEEEEERVEGCRIESFWRLGAVSPAAASFPFINGVDSAAASALGPRIPLLRNPGCYPLHRRGLVN
ncbi:uncharacterized protein PHA67_019844 [Liasis olivaceus]